MIVKINDYHQNYVNVRVNTKKYIRQKHYSKINFLKYADVKFILKIPIIYRKTWDDKWVLVDYNNYIDPVTKRFLVNNVLRDSIIRHPFIPLKYLKKKDEGFNTKSFKICELLFFILVFTIIVSAIIILMV